MKHLLRFAALYRRHFRDRRRERMMLASLSLFFTFAAVRILVHAFRDAERPFQVWVGGVHLHHFVWGIGILLLVGYLWLIQVGSGTTTRSERLGRLTAVLYGMGAALTLDEFALWLHLEDVYWDSVGRASIDAVVLFGALISAGLWGGPFWRASGRQLARLGRRLVRRTPTSVQPHPEESLARTLEDMLRLPAELPEDGDAGVAETVRIDPHR